MSKVQIVGLGPGDAELITLSAYRLMKEANVLFLRTHMHPSVAFLDREHIRYEALDYFDKEGNSFDEVCAHIVEYVLEQAEQRDVVYAVPGNPAVNKDTVRMLKECGSEVGIPVEIFPGMGVCDALEDHGTASLDLDPLVQVMADLRSKHGCPWDKAQTHQSLRKYLLEEVYEMLDAVDSEDITGIREEMGDILYQIVFHCRLAQEKDLFSIQDVVNDVCEKMIRRHPHVFNQKRLENVGESMVNWDRLKQGEQRQQHRYILDSVVKGMPSLFESYKMQEKSAKVGFEWDTADQVLEKLHEEWQEFQEALQENDFAHTEEEAGDVLFVLVDLFRRYHVESECALHRANSKFRRRFSYVEDRVKETGKSWKVFTSEELDGFWKDAKKIEKTANAERRRN